MAATTRRRTSSASKKKAPKKREPVCGFKFRETRCAKRGAHFCAPRAAKVVAFFEEILVHTKGRWARSAFVLDAWQRDDILRPVFGTVVWDPEFSCYRRQYRVLWVEIARKNGKTELLAGIALYLLVADDEEAPEVYGYGDDKDQAAKAWDVAQRMVELVPVLDRKKGGRLRLNRQRKRLSDEKSAGFYEIRPSDDAGELGHNPHGVVFDEFLTQASGELWAALRTATGSRVQPLFVIATTAGNDPESFAKAEHDEMLRVAEDPKRNPHAYVYVRCIPEDADPFDERNWTTSNPALGSFKSLSSMRELALEARNDPAKENSFRQFQANQWVQQVSRWMPLHDWDASAGMTDETRLAGRTCFAGLDLASTTDLAAWVLLFPPDDQDGLVEVLWRFWTPEAQIRHLDRYLGGRASVWARQGLLVATEGDWIEYWGDPRTGRSGNRLAIHPQIERDAQTFRVAAVGYDQKEATATAQHMQSLGLTVTPVYQGYALSESLKELMRLVKAGRFVHGGHPVARWCADSAEVRRDDQDRIKVVKPDRGKSGKRIDGIAAAANAINVWSHFDQGRVVLDGALMA